MGKQSAPPPPDYSPIIAAQAQASQEQTELGREQLAWAKQQYANQKPFTDAFQNQQLESSSEQQQFAQEQRKQYEDVFQPEQKKLVDEANTYDTTARRDLNIGAAQGSVAQNMDAARTNAQSQLESFGINPASTRYAALDVGTRAQQGASQAAAGTGASLQTEATGRQLTSQAANFGMAIPGQVEGTYGGSTNSGASGVNAENSTFATGAGAMGNPTQYFGMGDSALAAEGNTMNMQFSNALSSANANNSMYNGLYGALGTGFGMAAKGYFAASGGAIPEKGEEETGIRTDGKLFNDHDIVLLPAIADDGKHLQPHEAIRNFFMTGKHHGVFASHAEAKAHVDAHDQRQAKMGTSSYAGGGLTQTVPAPPPQAGPGQAPSGFVPPSASPSGGQKTDDINVNLNAGEFVFPKDVTHWMGEKKLQDMIVKAREEKAGAGAKPTQGPPGGRPTFQHPAIQPQAMPTR